MLCCTERERERKKKKNTRRKVHPWKKNNNCLFPLVSCLWICTALEKCINHFVHGTLKKLEIFSTKESIHCKIVHMLLLYDLLYTQEDQTKDLCFTVTAVLYINMWLTPFSG